MNTGMVTKCYFQLLEEEVKHVERKHKENAALRRGVSRCAAFVAMKVLAMVECTDRAKILEGE